MSAARTARSGRWPAATPSYDVTEREVFFAEPPASVVRIDDDDIALHNLDTIDLTGLYSEELADPAARPAPGQLSLRLPARLISTVLLRPPVSARSGWGCSAVW